METVLESIRSSICYADDMESIYIWIVIVSITLYSCRCVNFACVLWSGVLCLVRCTNRLHIHHRKLHGTVGEMVEGSWTGDVWSI